MMAMRYNIQFTVDTMVNESLVTRARNNLVSKFLANKSATHLMFIDADIGWDPDSVLKLALHKRGVVCGAYPMKGEPIRYALNPVPGGQTIPPLVEVMTSATGFMLIERGVIEGLVAALPQTKYRDNLNLGAAYEPHMYALFDTMIDEHGNYLSEDWTFCKRVREVLKQPVWVDTDIKLDHMGTHKFSGDPVNLKSLAANWGKAAK